MPGDGASCYHSPGCSYRLDSLVRFALAQLVLIISREMRASKRKPFSNEYTGILKFSPHASSAAGRAAAGALQPRSGLCSRAAPRRRSAPRRQCGRGAPFPPLSHGGSTATLWRARRVCRWDGRLELSHPLPAQLGWARRRVQEVAKNERNPPLLKAPEIAVPHGTSGASSALAVTGRGRARLPAALLGEPGGTAERCAALWARGRLPGTEAGFSS